MTYDWEKLEAEDRMMKYFKYEHLPKELQPVSMLFAEVARRLLELPQNAERTVAFRKLLEAKDCAVRARL